MHLILKVYTRMYKSARDLPVICQAHEVLRPRLSALLNTLDPLQEESLTCLQPPGLHHTEDAPYIQGLWFKVRP